MARSEYDKRWPGAAPPPTPVPTPAPAAARADLAHLASVPLAELAAQAAEGIGQVHADPADLALLREMPLAHLARTPCDLELVVRQLDGSPPSPDTLATLERELAGEAPLRTVGDVLAALGLELVGVEMHALPDPPEPPQYRDAPPQRERWVSFTARGLEIGGTTAETARETAQRMYSTRWPTDYQDHVA